LRPVDSLTLLEKTLKDSGVMLDTAEVACKSVSLPHFGSREVFLGDLLQKEGLVEGGAQGEGRDIVGHQNSVEVTGYLPVLW
jgi:hypothetical protein